MANYEPFTEQIESKLNELTLAEKVQLCHAATKFSVKGIARVGIPDIEMSDGPHGVRRELEKDSWDPVDTDDDYGTYLPTGTAVGAAWSRVAIASSAAVPDALSSAPLCTRPVESGSRAPRPPGSSPSWG